LVNADSEPEHLATQWSYRTNLKNDARN